MGESLQHLTDKNSIWDWQSKQEEAYQNIRRSIKLLQKLQFYDITMRKSPLHYNVMLVIMN